MGAGKGCSREENLLACQAFVAASKNSKKGNGQKTEMFEATIEKQFNELLDDMKTDATFSAAGVCTGSSISQRFNAIRKASIVFHGKVQSIYNTKPNGSPSEEDIRNASTAVYNELATAADMYKYFGTSTLKVRKPFVYLNCYKWMKGTYLWKMIVDATTKRNVKMVTM